MGVLARIKESAEALAATATKPLRELATPDDAVVLDVDLSLQFDRHSCGLQATWMIAQHHGLGVSYRALGSHLDTDGDGTSTGSIRDFFRKHGLKPVIRRNAEVSDLHDAINAGAPCLVSLDDEGHWGVVYGYAKGKVFLADPSPRHSRLGLRTSYATEDFCERWDNWLMRVPPRGVAARSRGRRSLKK
jgi:ABC-type bacteriocin/lantibiotic exporter with double-glycine peptidase domain